MKNENKNQAPLQVGLVLKFKKVRTVVSQLESVFAILDFNSKTSSHRFFMLLTHVVSSSVTKYEKVLTSDQCEQ